MSTVMPAAEVSDPDALGIRVYVNGELRLENSTVNLVRNVSKLIADVSEFMSLARGDVLLVGVPESAPRARAGDRIAVEIDGLGRLENTLRAEGATA
jgi:5-oxopent-3-ene-1,2,5-tricarboxylate decarboxylase/2-hydroxyhepta-2,4-diene-1,7-dioate isomerase